MTETRLSTRRELELMQRLQQLADRRAHDQRSLAAAKDAELAAAQTEFEEASRRQNEALSQRRRELENQFAAAKQQAEAALEQGRQSAAAALAAALKAADDRRDAALSTVDKQAQDHQWQALAVYDASKNQPVQALNEAAKRIQARRRQVEGLQRDARTLLEMRRLAKRGQEVDSQPLDPDAAAIQDSPDAKPVSAEQRLNAAIDQLRQGVLDLEHQRIASLFLEGGRAYVWLAAVVVVASIAGGLIGNFSLAGWLIGAAAGLALGLALLAVFIPRGRRWTLQQYAAIRQLVEQSHRLEQSALAEAQSASQRRTEEIVRQRDHDVALAQEARDRQNAELHTHREAEIARAEAAAAQQTATLAATHDAALAAADSQFPPLLEENALQRQQGDAENAARFDERRARANEQHAAAWEAMAEVWRRGFQEIAGELAAMQARCTELSPDWSSDDWRQWQRPVEPPEAVCLGHCPLPLQLVKNGVPEDKRLDPGVRRLDLPAAMVFSEQPRLVVTADGAGRRAAVEVLHLAMLRLLSSMPAGKLRFTIIDGAGLGENFAAFMHLADYDEQLVGSRIWTEPKQIDERLSLVSAHMEKVLQKYLRNEFATIHDYNRSAGEVAEPYHVVVAANFPAGFSESAARKLVAISQSGPRCGVFTLLSIDRQLRLPHEFKLDSLLEGAMELAWTGERLAWKYPLFERLPLQLNPLPPAERMIDVLRVAGQQSRDASRVEVPFALVAPAPDKIWSGDSAREVAAPIGRAGAKELQSLRLGLGTSQHALISGKTGSGKSTLLHALITNLALHYGPDQVEFYLIDFKKGVEFKAYATGELPHARVIAIESEREFGVSVLERLDQELRRRGELFRQHGVQDLAGFRRAAPEVPMPRTLLIVDEFQELFVADDKLAQDAALLLDRLVRQGRAFGVHVLLGSQTLAGAYSLARSTLGQMAVRIALQCSEADAHLILSDENTAARLLTRPGEAIYNDQNGLLVGNHPFQVVWLPDEQRQQYLAKLRGLPLSDLHTHDPAIVFEGNIPADPRDNPDLVAAISHPERTTHLEPKLWLGSAVRIEPATHLVLRRQGGNNLAIVGQDESLAAGMLANAVIALAAQHGEAGAKLMVLDGSRPETIAPGLWASVAAAVGEAVEVTPPRLAGSVVTALADEVARRGQSPEERFAAVYLVVYDLAQFRDLRQSEDDFSFSSSSKPPSVDKRFREILKEGPTVGVHVLLWCESYNTLTRSVDRLALREVEFRVAMQMSAGDSTSLIDAPVAALLGEHRALLYRDDLGTQTKFRPYGPPTPEWLAWAAEKRQDGVTTPE